MSEVAKHDFSLLDLKDRVAVLEAQLSRLVKCLDLTDAQRDEVYWGDEE